MGHSRCSLPITMLCAARVSSLLSKCTSVRPFVPGTEPSLSDVPVIVSHSLAHLGGPRRFQCSPNISFEDPYPFFCYSLPAFGEFSVRRTFPLAHLFSLH